MIAFAGQQKSTAGFGRNTLEHSNIVYRKSRRTLATRPAGNAVQKGGEQPVELFVIDRFPGLHHSCLHCLRFAPHFAQVVGLEQIVGGQWLASVILGIEHPKGFIHIVGHDAHQLAAGADEVQKIVFSLSIQPCQFLLKRLPNQFDRIVVSRFV